MANTRLSPASLTETAIALVDAEGFDALTLSAVAEALGVGPSALYTHCNGLDGLRHLVAVAATGNLSTNVRNAAIGTAGDDALTAMGTAYRLFARNHPGQFASTLRPPDPTHAEFRAATQSLLDVFVLVFTAMGLPPQESERAARSTRSAIHGFLALEYYTGAATGEGGESDDEGDSGDFQHLLDMLRGGLSVN